MQVWCARVITQYFQNYFYSLHLDNYQMAVTSHPPLPEVGSSSSSLASISCSYYLERDGVAASTGIPSLFFVLVLSPSATTQTQPLFLASEMVRVCESDSLQSAPLIYTSLSDSPSRQLLPAAPTQKSRMKLPTSDVWYHSNSEQPIRGLLGEEELWGQ